MKGRRGVKKRDDATMGKVLERDEPAGVRPAKRVARGPASRAGIETEGWADLKDGRSPKGTAFTARTRSYKEGPVRT